MANTEFLRALSDGAGKAHLAVPTLGADQTYALPATGGTLITTGSSVPLVSVNDVNYTITSTSDVIVAYATLTTARTVSLCAATNAGQQVVIMDKAGNCSANTTIGITVAGSDTIDGLPTITMGTPYCAIRLISDGVSKWTLQRSQLRSQTFTANGSWVCPPGVYTAFVTLAGGGGAGGGSSATNSGSGGGAGQLIQNFYPVVPNTSYSVTLGNGGTGVSGTTGGSGTSTSFGSLATALGGGGGTTGTSALTGSFTAVSVGTPGGAGTTLGYIQTVGYTSTVLPSPGEGFGGGMGTNSTATAGAPGGGWIGAGGAGGSGTSTTPGGGGGGGGYGAGGAGANGGGSGTAGVSAAANTGAGGGGAGAGGAKAGGNGGTGVCVVVWVE